MRGCRVPLVIPGTSCHAVMLHRGVKITFSFWQFGRPARVVRGGEVLADRLRDANS